MNFGELRDQFRLTLNRRDITPSQVDVYIKSAIQRTQRLLRVPASETTGYFNVGDDFVYMPIPGNYLKLISLRFNDDYELVKTDLTTALSESKNQGRPAVFARMNSVFVIGPKPYSGSKLNIVYHSDFSELNNPTDSNWLTQVAPDIIVNGAMSAACRVYVDPRRDSFEADFVQAINDLNLQASDDELVNSVISPAYYFDCE